MGMYRIKCTRCDWTTNPHYSIIDCVREKENEHWLGLRVGDESPHDSAFGDVCPRCNGKTVEEWRYFPDAEIKSIKEQTTKRWRI